MAGSFALSAAATMNAMSDKTTATVQRDERALRA
jgi:hypothetical protein